MGRSLGSAALLLAAIFIAGNTGQAVAAEPLPWCSKGVSITDAEISAPKKVAAGRHFKGSYALHTDQWKRISKIRIHLIPKNGKALVWKSRWTRATSEFWLEVKDGTTRYRVNWVETIEEPEGGQPFKCRNSIGTSITPWKGRLALFKIAFLRDGNVEWRLKNRSQLCGNEARKRQATSDYYQLRVRGLNGNVRSTLSNICEQFDTLRGKSSGKWGLNYWGYHERVSRWDFSPYSLPEGDHKFVWKLFRGRKKIQWGTFTLRVRIS